MDIDLFDSRRVSLLDQNYYSHQLSDRVTHNLDYSNFVKDNSELQISSGESNINGTDGDGNDYSQNEDLEKNTHPVLVIGVTGVSGHVNMTETSPSFYPFKVPEYIASGIKGWFSCDE